MTLAAALSAGSYSYSIKSMNNPPSGKTVDDIRIRTKSGAYYIEQYQLSLTMTQEASITISSVSPNNYIVSTNTTYVFSFTINAPICDSYYILITFPTDFTVNQYTVITTGIILSNTITASTSNNVLTLTKGISKYFDENFKADLTIRSILNPYSIKTSSAITIKITTSASEIVALSSTGFTITSKSGSFSAISITPSNPTIYSTTTYTFSMNLDQSVKSTSYIKITFPSEIGVASLASTTCKVTSGLSSSSLCSVSGSVLSINSGFSGSFSGKISFDLDSVTNSATTSPSSVFVMEAYSDENYLILYSNSYTLTASPGVFTSPSIESGSLVTGSEGWFAISLTLSHKIKAGGILEITFPSEVTLSTVSCSNPIGLSTSLTCSSASNTITVSNGFSTDKDSGTISITIQGARNPGTTQPTSSVAVYSKYNGYIIDYVSSGLIITMTTANSFKSVTVAGSSSVVGSKSDLTFNISPFNPMYNAGYINIYLPSTFICPSAPSCTVVALVKTVSCVQSSGFIKATLGFNSNTVTDSFSFKISSCTNPSNSAPSDSFQLYSFVDTYSIDQITSGVTLTASTPGALTIKVTPSETGISEIVNYVFKFTPNTSIPDNGYLEIQFPDSVTLLSTYSCTVVKSCTNTLNVLKAVVSATSSSSQFTVTNLQNPNSVSTVSLTITSKYNSYSIDSGTVSLTFTCYSPCATCSNSADYCLTCVSTFPYLYSNSCYSKCPTGTISVSPGTCTKCQDPCLECSGSVSTCTKCQSPLVLLSSECVNDCGVSKYNDTGICDDCINHCSECLDSVNCETCEDGFYLFEGTCKSVCPSGYLKVEENCEKCLEPCKTCDEELDYCTACIQNYSLFENECFEDCPDGTTSESQVCVECELPCLKCSEKTSKCTGCYSTWFLYGEKCVESCPLGTVVSGAECLDCANLCTVCKPDQKTCTSCETDAYLYKSTCVSACPLGTFELGAKCVDCSTTCKACSISASNCTSCTQGKYLYDNTCISTCPENITITTDLTCEHCDSTCETCLNSTETCTSCSAPYSLFEESCVLECPLGYNSTGQFCVLYECIPGCSYFMQTNSRCDSVCDVVECRYDEGNCKSSNSVALKSAPLPFTITGIGSGGILTASKAIFPTTSLTSGTIAVWGIFETGSWLCVLNEIAASDSKGRRLLTDDSDIQLAFILLLVCFVGHFFVNISFGVVYFYNILQKDVTLKFWMSNRKIAKWGVVPLALLINFKFIRILDAQLFGCSCLSASYDKKSNLYRPLVLFSYLSIILTTFPTLGSLIYILVIYDSDSMAFALALDSLLLTLLQLLLSIFDIITLSLLISAVSVPGKETKNVCISPNSELMNTQQFTIYNTKGEDTEKGELEMTGKIFPEPEDEKDFKDSSLMRKTTEDFIVFDSSPIPSSSNSRPDMWNISFESFSPAKKQQPCPRILELIKEESDIDLSNALIDEGSSIIANHIPSGRRVLISKTFKDSQLNESDPDLLGINYEQYVLENVDPENVRIGTLRSKTDGIKVMANRNFNLSQIIDIEENGQWTIGKVVKKEEDFDFAHAFVDPDDNEAVVVWNKVGKVYTVVKKDFKGLPKLDPRTILPMFNERVVSGYDPATVEVDSRNVHFANLIADGGKVRVRRNFIGGKILCVIDKDTYLDKKKRKAEIIEEPETELKTEELDLADPEILVPSEPRKIKKKKKKEKKFKGWDNIEAIYLQRLEPSIKLKRPKIEVANSFFVRGSDASHTTEMRIIEDEIVTPHEKNENETKGK